MCHNTVWAAADNAAGRPRRPAIMAHVGPPVSVGRRRASAWQVSGGRVWHVLALVECYARKWRHRATPVNNFTHISRRRVHKYALHAVPPRVAVHNKHNPNGRRSQPNAIKYTRTENGRPCGIRMRSIRHSNGPAWPVANERTIRERAFHISGG